MPKLKKIESIQYAGFWIRFFAYFADCLFMWIPILFINSFVENSYENDSVKLALNFVYPFFVYWIYNAFLNSSSWQATIGKKILGLKIVDENGNRISFKTATIRYLSEFISCIIFFIGYFMVIFTEKKQALHDKIAKTLVVKNNFYFVKIDDSKSGDVNF